MGLFGLVAAGIGMALQAQANREQRAQQEKLQQEQIKAQEKMNMQNQMMNLDTWEKTNADAQRKQYEKAGLNIGLMYKQGGAGGQLGNASGTAGMQQANNLMENVTASGQNAMQMEAQQAQIDLTKAQTENIEADTANKPKQGENIDMDTWLKGVEWDTKVKSQQDVLDEIEAKATQAQQQVSKNATEIGTLNATQQEEIQRIKLGKTQAQLTIGATKAGIINTQANTAETQEKIKRIAQDIVNMRDANERGWEELALKKVQTEFNTATPEQIKQWSSIITDIGRASK